ncbi:MAG TPA: DUF58 domain-containing protein [Bradyrhizobium sp.]|nr:DUF58 domain-containing protein [Bradyrhizobium sp.]
MPSVFNLDAKAFALCEDLELLARTIVEGFFDGLHRSPFLGYSTEFSAYRPYSQGDDLRRIDWKVWGRTDELYVKQFEDDTNLRCQLFLDTSASMDFGRGDANKFHYGRVLAAVLAQLMTRQHDAPGLILFSEQASQAVPPVASRHHADPIFIALSQAQAAGRTVLGQNLIPVLESLNRRGVAVVISDFFSPGETAFQLLGQLRAQEQEVIVFQLLAPEELDLPFEGDVVMEDSETGEELPVQADEARREYRQRLEDFCNRLANECLKLEIDYCRMRTDAPLDAALLHYFDWRNGI